jgi:hypothetical protein
MKKTEKKKGSKQLTALREGEKEDRMLLELVQALEDLEEEGKFVDLQICPKCKSPKVRKVGTMSGDLWGCMGILPPKFECEECGGWRGRLVLNVSNRSLSIRDVAMIIESADLDET